MTDLDIASTLRPIHFLYHEPGYRKRSLYFGKQIPPESMLRHFDKFHLRCTNLDNPFIDCGNYSYILLLKHSFLHQLL